MSPATDSIIRSTEFHLVSELARTDAKKRISLGTALSETLGQALTGTFNIYRNPCGQFVLDPVVPIPASEVWLFQNPAALASVKQGLVEAGQGRTLSRGSFAKHAR